MFFGEVCKCWSSERVGSFSITFTGCQQVNIITCVGKWWLCGVNSHEQLNPLPVNPISHVQLKDSSVSMHVALVSQGLDKHSFTSAKIIIMKQIQKNLNSTASCY